MVTVENGRIIEKTVSMPDMINAKDLASKILPETFYPVCDLIPEGETVIAAPPKTGKSWLMLQMCLAVSTGSKFLNFATNRCGALYIALEDGEKFEQERLFKLINREIVPDNMHFIFDEVKPLDDGFLEQLDMIKQNAPDIRLIVIDTLNFIHYQQKRSESAYACDYRTGKALKAWADAHGVAVVVVTHTRKLITPEDALANVSGTTGVTGAADAIVVISKEKRSDKNAVLVVDGRRVRQSESSIFFDQNSCSWIYGGPNDDHQKELKEQAEIRAAFLNSKIRSAVLAVLDQPDNAEGWKGGARQLQEAALDCEVYITESSKEIGGFLCNTTNRALFAEEDKVIITIVNNGNAPKIYSIKRK